MDTVDETATPDIVMWWSRCVKRNIRLFFTREGAERRREDQANEIFYYSCIYEILNDRSLSEKKNSKTISLQGEDRTHLQ
jgi:hypothetical protein